MGKKRTKEARKTKNKKLVSNKKFLTLTTTITNQNPLQCQCDRHLTNGEVSLQQIKVTDINLKEKCARYLKHNKK